MATLTLRPNADVSGITQSGGADQGTSWDPYVASAYAPGNGWATVDDAVTQPTVPDTTDYLRFTQAGPITAILDLTTSSIPGGESVTGATVWCYYSNANAGGATFALKLTKADGTVLATTGNYTTATNGIWLSASYSGTLTQAEVDGLRATLTDSNSISSVNVSAVYAQVMTATGGGGGSPTRQSGTATFTRSIRNDGKVVETITSSGTWYAPPGVTSVDVQAWGAGGAGGTSTLAQGGGGGGGAYAGGTVTVNPSTPVTITIPPSVSASATNGGNASFGSSVIAAGGTGGAASGLGTGAGGAGGTTAASTGTVKFAGGAGATGGAGGGSGGGGGAGGAASGNTGGAAGITASGQANPGAAGGTGGTTATGGTPGGGAGSNAELAAVNSSGPGSVVVVYTETGNNNVSTTLSDSESLAANQTNTSVVSVTDVESFTDEATNPTSATHTASAATSETQLQILVSTITSGQEAIAEALLINSVASQTALETLAADQTNFVLATITDSESVADRGDTFTSTMLSASDALAQAQILNSIATMFASEALAQTVDLVTIATLTGAGSFSETQLQILVSTITAGEEALAETKLVTAIATHTDLESLADRGLFGSAIIGSGPWKLISSGLSGVAYDSTGTNVIAGAQVLVFEDPSNVVAAQFVTDALGYWFTQADPNKRYWISYWIGNAPPGDISGNLSWRTDRYIAPVDTVIDTGTSS